MLERTQQVGAEAALGGIGLSDPGTREQLREEGLGEFPALVLAATFAAQEAEDRRPVGLAEIAERGAGLGGVPRARMTIVQRVVKNTA